MDDLISRQAAIDAANDWLLDCFKVKKQDRSCGLIRRLEDLPSAHPERPKGEWVEKPHVYGVAYCSLCDYELHTNDTNFCPNCGADMRGDQNE